MPQYALTHSFPVHPFSTLWKHQKTLRFSDVFRGYRKGALGTNGLSPSVCLSMSEYWPDHGWILLNAPEYIWKSLNKLFWLCQVSQYTSSSWIFDRVFNMPPAIICAGSKYAVLLYYNYYLLELYIQSFCN